MKLEGSRLAAGAAVVALVLTGSARAATIVGTARADVLRGSPGPDSIYGRAGNDRLYGAGGSDRLYGGAGADRIACGGGRDTAFADARDVVARDCEVIRRPAPPPHHPPPPPPAPEPPAPPAPPPPAPPSFVVPGHYVALTEQERYVHLEVYPNGRALTNLRVEYDADCVPPPPLRGPYADVVGDVAIDAQGTFAVAVSLEGGRIRLSARGTFDAAGNLAGTFRAQVTAEADGARRECDSGTVPFRGGRR